MGSVPSNVPRELAVDIDIYRLDVPDGDAQLAWYELQRDNPDLFWTPHHGGHWIATRGSDIKTIQLDYRRFSQRSNIIPPTPMNMIPMNVDPPEQAAYRAIIQPAFAPHQLAHMEARVRKLAVDLIEDLMPRGECEFVSAFASKLPVLVFLKMMDLPEGDREYLKAAAEPLADGDASKTVALLEVMKAYLAKWIDVRSSNPGEDVISRIVHAKVDGRALARSEIEAMCLLLLLGGLDTVVALLSFCARFLALHPAHRRELIEHPGIMPNAIEELIRRHGIVNTARLITRDFEYKGVHFLQGDHVCIPNCLYGLDDRLFENPLQVDFRREPTGHSAFGAGPHFCPGAALTKRELAVFIEEWLRRIPDFQLTPGMTPIALTGNLNTMRRLHLSW